MSNRNPGSGQIALLSAAIVVIIFLSLGFVFLFTNLMHERVKAPNRYYVGGLLIIWSAARAFTAWRRYKRDQREANDEENDPDFR